MIRNLTQLRAIWWHKMHPGSDNTSVIPKGKTAEATQRLREVLVNARIEPKVTLAPSSLPDDVLGPVNMRKAIIDPNVDVLRTEDGQVLEIDKKLFLKVDQFARTGQIQKVRKAKRDPEGKAFTGDVPLTKKEVEKTLERHALSVKRSAEQGGNRLGVSGTAPVAPKGGNKRVAARVQPRPSKKAKRSRKSLT